MPRKKASEIFGLVDADLTVIDGGRRHRGRKKRVKKLTEIANPALEPYNPQPITEDDWNDAEGKTCPICGQETQRLIPYGFTGKRKACPVCIDRRKKLLEYKARVVAPRFRPKPPRMLF